MASKAPNGPKSEATDLGSLWKRAIDDYFEKTGKNLSHMKAQNIGAVMDMTKDSMQTFQGKRHNGEKVDKVRSAFGRHLGGMQMCMRGIQAVGNAAGAFPPAMPVGIIFAACGHLLSAFATVKADYDKVEDFFNHSSRFFERLSIIEGKISDVEPLGVAIVRVFSSQLSICATVESMISEKGSRWKQFLSALWNGQDGDLAAAYGVMQASIEELAQSVGYASYAAIKSTQEVTVTISAKADEIDANISTFRSELKQDVRLLYESNLNLKLHMTEGFNTLTKGQTETQDLMKEKAAEDQARFKLMMKEFQSLNSKLGAPDKDTRKPVTKGSGKGDAGDGKFKALRQIKTFFDGDNDTFSNWKDAQKENAAQQQDMRESFVSSTASWLPSDASFQQWVDGKNPLLWISGPDGIGKSFLAYAASQKLPSRDDGHTSVAYFYFKEDFPSLQSAQNAFACTALQIAETNARYAEIVAAKLKEDGNQAKDVPTWRRFFLSIFSASSQSSSATFSSNDRLFLIFDGLDEASEQQRSIFLEFLADLKKEKSTVRALVTSRPEGIQPSKELEPIVLEATKEKMKHDIRALIWNRLNTFGRLKKFSIAAKKLIRKKVAKQADGMLYVEHMLRRLSYMGREGAVLKDLEKMPSSLHDLYKVMLDECRRNRSKEQYQALKRLFAWLAFSKRSLSLAEATELVKLTITKDDFDVEDEIIGRSARILELSRTRVLDEDHKDDAKDDDNDDDGDEPDTQLDEYRHSSLTFQERSLRQYFKAISVDAHGEEELRTPASAAHLTILKMCIDILMSAAEAGEGDEASELRSYAINYWYEHLNELDIEAASDEEVGQVLTSVHRIASNERNVAKLFERHALQSDLYPEREEAKTTPWYDRLQTWAAKGAAIPETLLHANVKTWAAEVAAEPKEILASLAKAHVENWFAEANEFYSLEAYGFAEATLNLSGRFEKAEDDPLKEILSVAETFEMNTQDFKAMRAIGTRLMAAAYDIEDEERREQIQAKAIDYLNKGLDSTEDDNRTKGYIVLTIANYYSRKDDFQNGIDYLDKALENFSAAKSDASQAIRKEMDEICLAINIGKARYLRRLEKKDESLHVLNEARKLAGEDTIGNYNLDEITSLLDEEVDPDGRRLMDALKSWTEKERNSWFEYCLQYWADLDALGRMYRAAKLTKETDLALDWLNAFGKTIAPRSLILFNLKAALADFHNRVLGDVDKAKEAMRVALDLDIHPNIDSSEDYVLNERLSAVRMELAGIIFSQFRSSPDPKRKEALLGEIKSLPGMRTEDDFRESHIGMLVANMLRIMGPAREYQNSMDQIFKTCIDGLEDNVAWNDGDSLRLLAKVLSSLDGLERDARITISAQFSIMDRSIYNSESGSDAASEGEAGSGSEEEEAAQESASTEAAQVNGHSDGHTPSNGDVATTEAQEGSSPPTASVEQPSPSVDEKGSLDVNEEPPATQNGEQPLADAADDAAQPTTEASDEDIADYGIGCDGCGVNITSWTQPIYFCLMCPNTDLCEDCHAKRLSWNQNPADAEKSWKSFCSENHYYIKGPMKGWRGIKNGVVRVGEDEFSVKDWIKELKEVKWPKAWEKWWLRQGGLKDVGDEE